VLAIAMNMVAAVGVVFGLYAVAILVLWMLAAAMRVRDR
jgi:hypothetical protein